MSTTPREEELRREREANLKAHFLMRTICAGGDNPRAGAHVTACGHVAAFVLESMRERDVLLSRATAAEAARCHGCDHLVSAHEMGCLRRIATASGEHAFCPCEAKRSDLAAAPQSTGGGGA